MKMSVLQHALIFLCFISKDSDRFILRVLFDAAQKYFINDTFK